MAQKWASVNQAPQSLSNAAHIPTSLTGDKTYLPTFQMMTVDESVQSFNYCDTISHPSQHV